MTQFAHRYTPTRFEDLAFADHKTHARLADYANGKRCGHLLLHGAYGTGKSTIARVIAISQFTDSTLHAANTWTGKQIAAALADDIPAFVGTWSLLGIQGARYPYAIIDEVDQLTRDQQLRLRGHMDRFAAVGSLIFTTNNLHSIDPGLVNRCDAVQIDPLPASAMSPRATAIFAAEGLMVDPALTQDLMEASNGNWRDALRAIEEAVIATRSRAA